jgi:group I intron endonuclease
MGCIYRARNTVNGKCYVGKTVRTMARRKAWHQAAASRGEGWSFHRALRKYGFDKFVWEVVCSSDDSEELGRLEVQYIALWKTKRPDGYNLTDGGDGVIGPTPEGKARVIAFHTGRKRSLETRARISASMKGKRTRLGSHFSEESKKRISASLCGRKLSEEVKAKIGTFHSGKPKTPEQKARMSEARKRWWENKKSAIELGNRTAEFGFMDTDSSEARP